MSSTLDILIRPPSIKYSTSSPVKAWRVHTLSNINLGNSPLPVTKASLHTTPNSSIIQRATSRCPSARALLPPLDIYWQYCKLIMPRLILRRQLVVLVIRLRTQEAPNLPIPHLLCTKYTVRNFWRFWQNFLRIILYAITGCVSALFCVVIISGVSL